MGEEKLLKEKEIERNKKIKEEKAKLDEDRRLMRVDIQKKLRESKNKNLKEELSLNIPNSI